MREEDTRWEEELPSPEELMPLSQTLISPDLALAFDIPNHQNHFHQQGLQQQQLPSPSGTQGAGPQASATPPTQGNSCSAAADYETVAGSGDEPARTLKRPRLVWTPQLHKRFVDAVAHLGIKNAVPKTIMQLMSVDGLTRENVASHLQKYRLYLKRMQGIHSSNGSGGGSSSNGGLSDSATDRLFASSPVPAHFLRPNSDHFMPPYVPVTAVQMPVPMVGHGHPQLQHHQQQQQFRGHFGNSPPNGGNGQFEQHPFLARQPQVQSQRIGATVHGNNTNGWAPPSSSYAEDMESAAMPNGRKVLTLFPTADD